MVEEQKSMRNVINILLNWRSVPEFNTLLHFLWLSVQDQNGIIKVNLGLIIRDEVTFRTLNKW